MSDANVKIAWNCAKAPKRTGANVIKRFFLRDISISLPSPRHFSRVTPVDVYVQTIFFVA